jgi:uncharacterized protein (TIGR03437 family)
MRRICLVATFAVCFASVALSQPHIDGITNAADFTLTLSPGAIGTVFGSGFAPSAASSSKIPLPTTLNTVSVLVNGISAPLFFVNQTQANFQVPFETTLGTASVMVQVGTTLSTPVQMIVAAFSPGTFLYGAGRGVIQNQDFSLNTTTNPATGGSTIIAYLTGIGAGSAKIADGAASPGSPPSTFPGTATATIGDVNAPVGFLGYVPGLVGLVQANVTVPSLPTGDYPFVLSLNGQQNVSSLVSLKGTGTSFVIPDLLTLVSSISVPGLAQTVVPGISGVVTNSLALYKNTLYICSASDLKIVDVTDPTAPRFLSKLDEPGFAGSAHNCTVNTAATKPFLADLVRASQSVVVFDLSTPTTPELKSQKSIPLVPRSVTYQGNTGFFGEDLFSHAGHDVDFLEGNMVSVDYTNPAAPVIGPLVKKDAAHPETNNGNIRPYMISPEPNLIYAGSTTSVSNFNSGVGALDLFDVTNPKSIVGAGQFLVPGSKVLLTLTIQGNEMLAVGDTRGFSPGNTLANGAVDFPFAGFMTLTMFDVTDLTKPKMQGNVVVNTLQPGNIGGPISIGTVALGGGFYVVTCAAPDLNASGESGVGSLVIVDGRDPQNPKAYTYATLSGLGGLNIANGFLYAAVGSGANVYKINLP